MENKGLPDSTLRGNAEFGDNNQVAVSLVIYLFLAREIIGGTSVFLGLRLRVQYISLESTVYRLLDGLGLREMENVLIWCTWIRQGLVSI